MATKLKKVPYVVLAENGKPVGYCQGEKNCVRFIEECRDLNLNVRGWRYITCEEYTTKL